ncbi:hypothetical protein ABGF49_01925 [Helcococcus ovis]|nr:hypothetical protein [Helcococcus ovis]WNZ01581.1 hypothetical protein EQF90_001670 [Helcococcus ovis]
MIYSYKKSDGKTWYYIKYNTNGKSYKQKTTLFFQTKAEHIKG